MFYSLCFLDSIAGLAITNNDRYFIVGGLKDGSISVYDIVKHSHVSTISEKYSGKEIVEKFYIIHNHRSFEMYGIFSR